MKVERTSAIFDNMCRKLLEEKCTCITEKITFIVLELLRVRINVKERVGKHESKIFATIKGVRQGDALGPIVFFLYLSNTAAGVFMASEERDHDYENPRIRFSDDRSL